MNNIIPISALMGIDLRTRSFFRRDIEHSSSVFDYNVVLDFADVQFISRSVADELCEILSQYPQMKTIGMDGDVRKMFDIVKTGREKPREYTDTNAKVVHLRTQKDMDAFFSTF